jgi:SAM-dependent methyltransferase
MALRRFARACRRRLKRTIRRLIGDPECLLEEYPDSPGLFHGYRGLLATGHQRVPGGWLWEGRFYPDCLTVGGASYFIQRRALRWCQGEGLDIGAGHWPLPGAKPIDPVAYPAGLMLDQVAPASQDYVFSSHCLEHIAEWQSALAEWVSKLKPQGILFLYLPHPDCGLWRMDNPFMAGHHKWVPEPATVKAALQRLDLEIVDSDDGPDGLMSFFVCARTHRIDRVEVTPVE